jgi:hypothetical protein
VFQLHDLECLRDLVLHQAAQILNASARKLFLDLVLRAILEGRIKELYRWGQKFGNLNLLAASAPEVSPDCS